ncbi:disks large-associated protein 4-like [Asterias rubens]|uniref:disks large-associated protein 4-like n=1 Tax=Asterias rubens TaxID=7604 RepID=UPI0014558064|nr:disks large-associated protein 4-like [Asterias rubens]
MSISSKRSSASTGAPISEERNGKAKSSSSASSLRKSISSSLTNSNVENTPSPYAPQRERSASVDQKKKQATASRASTTKSKSRTEALLSRKVTGSATSVRTQASISTRPPTGKAPRRSTSADKVQAGSENGCISGQSHPQDQASYRTSGTRPQREVSSASSSSSSEGDERGVKGSVSPQKSRTRRSVTMEENGVTSASGSPQGRSSVYSKSKTPPSVRRKSSPPSSENNSRFQRHSSLRSSQNGRPQQSTKKSATRTLSSSSLDNGSSTQTSVSSESESAPSRKLRNGTAAKSSSEDSISDSERKSKSALSRTPSTKRKVCMEIVMEKKIISKSNATPTAGKTESVMGKSPSKQSLSSPTDENSNSTRTSPTKLKSASTVRPSVLGSHTGARMKVRTATTSSDRKSNGAYNVDKSRIVSAPTFKRTDQSLPSISPSGPMRAKSGSARTGDMKQNLKSPDRSRVATKTSFPNRSRARARSMEPVARNVTGSTMTTIDAASHTPQAPEGSVVTTHIIHARRSQSQERRSNKDSFVASRRQAWEEKASHSPAEAKKASATSPEKRFQRGGVGRRSLIDERKAMLFGGFTAGGMRGQVSGKKPAIPAKPENLASKPPLNIDQKGQIELYINEELPTPAAVVAPVHTSGDTCKPAVLQENVLKIQPNAINLMPKLQPSTDEVDSTRRYSPSKENEIISTSNDKMYSMGNDEYGDALEKWSMLKENQSVGEPGKKREENKIDNKQAESRRQALVNRERETSNHKKQTSEPKVIQVCPAEVKDGHYYLRIVNEEQSRLETLSMAANKDMEKELSEEVCGKLRATIGKAYLLTHKKFKQFRGLCEQNVNPSEADVLSVTDLDLAGFWDMVLIQVDDVNSMFKEIEGFRQNGWRTPKQSPQKLKACGKKPSVTSPPPSPGIYKTTSNPLAQVNADPKAKAEREKKAAKARQTRDDARKRLIAAKRAAARKRVKSEDGEPPVEIFVPDK